MKVRFSTQRFPLATVTMVCWRFSFPVFVVSTHIRFSVIPLRSSENNIQPNIFLFSVNAKMKQATWLFGLLMVFAVSESIAESGSFYGYRLRPFYRYRMKLERIGPGKNVAPIDIRQSKSLGYVLMFLSNFRFLCSFYIFEYYHCKQSRIMKPVPFICS